MTRGEMPMPVACALALIRRERGRRPEGGFRRLGRFASMVLILAVRT